MATRQTAYQHGYEDAHVAIRESGETSSPVDGWDGWLINGIGVDGVCALFGVRAGSKNYEKALRSYSAGALRACGEAQEADDD